MTFREKKDKLICNLKQECFRRELEMSEYDCYTSEQKRYIMRLIKTTRWEVPFIREVFQDEQIKKNIDRFIYIFEVMKSKDERIRFFCWHLVCRILISRKCKIDFNVVIAMLESFTRFYVPKEKYYQACKLAERFIIDDGEVNYITKMKLFKSVLNATDKGLELGNKLFYLYSMCECDKVAFYLNRRDFDISYYFDFLSKVYRGTLDYCPDIWKIIDGLYTEIKDINSVKGMFEGTDQEYWEIENHAEAFNQFMDFMGQMKVLFKKLGLEIERPGMPKIRAKYRIYKPKKH